MKVLLVEDDSIIWQNICEYLEENSFMVTLKDNWEDWLKEAIKNKYDIFIFDVMLPKKDWFQMAKEIREAEVKTPIIFLTAKEDLESKERWFNVWWDDYLTKPFKLKELILRMRSILKRINQTEVLDKITAWDKLKRGKKMR